MKNIIAVVITAGVFLAGVVGAIIADSDGAISPITGVVVAVVLTALVAFAIFLLEVPTQD